MKTEKMDRRVKYTTLLLKGSLIKLMKNYSISKISVKMLCEDADINRSTFYAHYNDQFDLLRQLEQEVITEFENYIDMHTMTDPVDTVAILKQLLEYAAKNVDLFRVLLSENGDSEFQRDILSLAQRQIISNLKSDQSLDPRTSEYLQRFIIAGALEILQKWIQDGTVESTQQMAELLSKLLFQGVSSFFKNISDPTKIIQFY